MPLPIQDQRASPVPTSSSISSRPATRLRSRTATLSSMSRESAAANLIGATNANANAIGHSLGPGTLTDVEILAPRLDSAAATLPRTMIRKSSKSVSAARPPLSTSAGSHRALSYHSPTTLFSDLPEATAVSQGLGTTRTSYMTTTATAEAGPSSSATSTPAPTPSRRAVGGGLKRRISTPNLTKRALAPDLDHDDDLELVPSVSLTNGPGSGSTSSPVLAATAGMTSRKYPDSRARATSTSLVVPQTLPVGEGDSTEPVQTLTPHLHPHLHPHPHVHAHGHGHAQPHTQPHSFGPAGAHQLHLDIPHYALPTPPPSYLSPSTPSNLPPRPDRSHDESSTIGPGFLAAVYDLGEAAVSRVLSLARPAPAHSRRSHSPRGSDDDSEKGLDGSEDEVVFDDDVPRVGLGAGGARGGGKYYWGLFGSESGVAGAAEVDSTGASYFTLPPTPPEDPYETRSGPNDGPTAAHPTSLPTPAISAHSLSRRPSRLERAARRARRVGASTRTTDGWWIKVYRAVSGGAGAMGGGRGKTAEVARELGWTVALLAAGFVVSFLLVLWLVQWMPITQLKHLPKSTTDLQLLSAEIRAYMASSSSGWWHTIAVLTYIGCWKHAWSVPGAVVLNILVGSVLEPIPALALLTVITATGSLCAYLLSRPLAPLIAVLFPKPLALVRAALAPDSIPAPPPHTTPHPHSLPHGHDHGPTAYTAAAPDSHVTPVHLSSDPRDAPLGGPEAKPNVWRRLLVMRAMGFVPWSGMNVACGVVGVDWKVFWMTTAAGSASWSYVTASVGNILSRLALPATVALDDDGVLASASAGESLTSLLRDPVLIAKLIFLSLLTLIPVFLKRQSSPTASSSSTMPSTITTTSSSTYIPAYQPGSSGAVQTHGHHVFSHSALGLDPASMMQSPASPLTTSLASFTPTPHVFDLLSFGRTAARQGTRVAMASARGAVTQAQRLVGA